jgi:tetratricopeptide (TPR) repeat protein
MPHLTPAQGARGGSLCLSLSADPRSIRCLGSCALFALLLIVGGCGASPEQRLEEARAMQDVGEFTASVEPLREILEQAPGHPEANYRLGVALVRQRQSNSAIWRLERAAESAEFAEAANLALASLYLALKDYERALAAVDRVLALKPEDRAALSYRYKVNLDAKRQEDALGDLDRLLESDPDDAEMVYARAVTLGELGRLEESEAAHRRFMEVAAASDEPGLAARACAVYALAFQDYAEDDERAEKEMERCLDAHPDDPFVVQQTLALYDEGDRSEQALALLRRVFEASPEDLPRRVSLANRLRDAGRGEEAEALLLEAIDESAGLAERLALAEFYSSGGEARRALELAEQVFEILGGPRSDQARFTYADILVDAEELERADEVAAEIEDPVYRQLIEGRITLMRGDAAGALGLLDAAVQQWPDNAGARHLAGIAALQVGETERAVSHLREAVRADRNATDAALLLARFYLERAEYEEAVRFARSQVRSRGRDRPEGYAVWARALVKQGEVEAAREVIARLEEKAGLPMEAAVERAILERETTGPSAALAVIEDAGLDLTDVANEPALRSVVEDLLALGRNEEAMSRVATALAAHPDAATLHALKGRLHTERGEADAAREAFEKSRELEEGLRETLLGLASVAALVGEQERAVQLFDEVAAAHPQDDAVPAYAAAQLVLGAGRKAEAEQRLRAIVRRHPGAAGARNDLAWLLAQSQRELELALELAEDAVRMDPQAAILDTLGYVHLQRGEGKQAVSALRRSLDSEPNAPSVRYRLGLALAQVGDSEGARAAFREALDAGPFPESEAAQRELAGLVEQP